MTYIEESHLTLPPATPAPEVAAALFYAAPQVYACLDANRIRNLPLLLAASGLAHACLFQGALLEEAGDAAPWLVALDPEHKLTRDLFTPADKQAAGRIPAQKPAGHPFALWEAEAGIYLQTAMPLADLRQHLRRFLRVSAADGRAFFFRFWEPAAAAVYFSGLNDRPELIRRWFTTREGHVIDGMVIARPGPEGYLLSRLKPQGIGTVAEPPMGSFKLSESDIRRFMDLRLGHDAGEIARRLEAAFPDAAKTLGAQPLIDFTRREMARMQRFGFRKKAHLFMLLAWELHFGPGFEHRDPSGAVAALLADPHPENQRFPLLEQRMIAVEAGVNTDDWSA